MKLIPLLGAFLLVGFLFVAAAARPGDTAASVDHGKYLAEHVAMCIQCHTPRDEEGNLLLSQRFQGAPVPFVSPWPNSRWANTAPSIAGLPQYTTDQAVKLLTTGISRTGQSLRSPMPPFRMSESDARDIIAYLKSLE